MKVVNVTFTDDEYKMLVKNKGNMSWHEYLLFLAGFYDKNKDGNKNL